MANKEHLAILKRGVEAWNAWRKSTLLALEPDLSDADLTWANLSGADLNGAILTSADLTGVDLSGATLRVANLSKTTLSSANLTNARLTSARLTSANLTRATLSGATLSGAKFFLADLTGADLTSATLTSATLTRATLIRTDFSGADLSGATLIRAALFGAKLIGTDLSRANLSRANLSDATFCDARLKNTIFSSRAAINSLNQELSPEQLIGCIFLDEEDTRRTKEKSSFEGLPMLCLHFDAPIWTPLDASMALANVQLTINRVQYLLTTEETSSEILEQTLTGPCFPADFNQAIRLAELHTGSLEIILGYIREAFSPEMVKVLVVSGLLVWGAGYACEKYVAIQLGAATAFKRRAEGKRAIADTEKSRADAEKSRADTEKSRADAEKSRADAEKSRAERDAIRAKLAKEAALSGEPDLTDISLPRAANNGIPKIPLEVVEENIKVPSAFTPVSETVRQSPEKYLSRAVQPLYSFISVIKDQGHEVRCRIYNAKEWAEKYGVDLTEAEKAGIISDQPKKTSGDNNK